MYSRIPCQRPAERVDCHLRPADTRQIAVAVTDWFGNAAVKALPVPLRLDVLDCQHHANLRRSALGCHARRGDTRRVQADAGRTGIGHR